MELMTAVAQPGPVPTVKAQTGQFRLQAPHSMQASRFEIRARPFSMTRTSRGQTSRHMPQPMHFPSSS